MWDLILTIFHAVGITNGILIFVDWCLGKNKTGERIMKQIKFDARFKEAILNKRKVATIRNDKKVEIGEIFEVVVDGEVVGNAVCNAVIKLETWDCINNSFRNGNYNDTASFRFIWGESFILVWSDQLGFKNGKEAFELYKTYLKNEHCYLHIFELIKEKE